MSPVLIAALLALVAGAGEPDLEVARARAALAEGRPLEALDHARTALDEENTEAARTIFLAACGPVYSPASCEAAATSAGWDVTPADGAPEPLTRRECARTSAEKLAALDILQLYALLERARTQPECTTAQIVGAELERRGETRRKPLDVGSALAEAERLAVAGHAARAVDLYEEARRERDSVSLIDAELELLGRMGRTERAAQVAQEALLVARTPAELAQAWRRLGGLQSSIGHYDQALVSLRTANALAPTPEGLLAEGMVAASLHRPVEAFYALCGAHVAGASGAMIELSASWLGPGDAVAACEAQPVRDTSP